MRETLPNGIQLLLIEDRELPTIGVRAVIRGGTLAEGKLGVSDLFGTVLRTGGTTAMAGDALDETLERMGASIESGADLDGVEVTAFTLTETVDKVLPLYADVVLRPAFAQDKLDLAKTQARSGIARRNDDAMGVGGREFSKLIYGASSPYAKQLEYETVDAITRDDLVAFHKKTFRPDQAIVAAWGDFKADEMKARLAKLFGGWKAEGTAAKVAPPPVQAAKPSLNYVSKADAAQTFLFLGQRGLRYDDKDYAAVQVMQEILGGGFSSRLFNTIRTKKGLAYGAGGAMVPGYDHDGVFYFFTSTKPETTSEALAAMLEEIERIRREPVSDAELQRAKDTFLNGYVFDFDTRAEIVNRLVTYQFYGYPPDFNDRVKNAVEKVTKADVQRVARERLDPAQLTVLAVGQGEKFDKPLSTFSAAYGPVRTIDITIPEPKGAAAPQATAQSLARGKELLAKAAAARGKGLAGVTSVTTSGTLTQQTPMGPMDLKVKSITVLPDWQYAEVTTPMGVITLVVDKTRAVMKAGGQQQALPPSQAEETRGSLPRDMGGLLLLQEALAGKVEAQALGVQKIGDVEAEALLVTAAGKPFRMFLDPKTYDVLGFVRQGTTPEGPAEITERCFEYKDVSGVRVPTRTESTANGKPLGGFKADSIEINAAVDPNLFK